MKKYNPQDVSEKIGTPLNELVTAMVLHAKCWCMMF